jgi:hypothetical protein
MDSIVGNAAAERKPVGAPDGRKRSVRAHIRALREERFAAICATSGRKRPCFFPERLPQPPI